MATGTIGSNSDAATGAGSVPESGTLFAGLMRRAPLIVACTVLTAAAALVFSVLQTKEYTARASLLFRDPGFDQRIFGSSVNDYQDPTRLAATNITLVSLGAVADRTAATSRLGLTGPEISDNVSVKSEGQSDVASVEATDQDPDIATRLANAFAQNYIVFRRDADRRKVDEARRLVQSDLDRLSPEARLSGEGQALQKQLSRLSTLAALQTGNAELVQRATVPTSPSSPKTLRNTILGGALGLFLGLGLAVLLQRVDRRLREPNEFQHAFGLPVLAEVIDSKALGESQNGTIGALGAEGAAFQMLRARLRYFNVDRDIRSVLITSAAPGEGKTTIARNLAASAATTGLRTLLIEADLHQPTLSNSPGIKANPGLAELLSAQTTIKNAVQEMSVDDQQRQTDGTRGFDLIVAGSHPPNPVELLESDVMRDLITTASDDYDLVVIDSPPLPLLADTIPLVNMVDGVIVVARASGTTHEQAHALRAQLESLNAPLLGVVVNRAPRGRGGYYGYYMPQPSRHSAQTDVPPETVQPL